MKQKVTDDQITELIKQGLNNKQIIDRLGIAASGYIYSRINRLRELPAVLEFDLQLYDTLAKGGIWYRVIAIDQDGFMVKRICIQGDAYRQVETLAITKEAYLSGKSGYVKREMAPVTSYIDESLIKPKEESMDKKPADITREFKEELLIRKPATINQEWEDAVQDMVEGGKTGQGITKPVEVEPMINLAENTPENGDFTEFDAIVDITPENDYLADIDQIVCICKTYAGSPLVCDTLRDLTRLILDSGISREMKG